MRPWKPWEIAAAAAGSLIAVCGTVLAVLSICKYCASQKAGQHSDYVW